MLRKEEILERTSNGLAIFKHYLPGNWRIGRNFLNPLYEDSKASCNIYFDRRSSIYKMKDFGNDSYSGDCFFLVGQLKGLDCNRAADFVEILEIIDRDLGLGLASGTPVSIPPATVHRTVSDKTEETPEKPVKPYQFREQKFPLAELVYWQQYGITPELLERYKVCSLREYHSETVTIPPTLVYRLTFRFKHIVLLFDMDKTGRESSCKQEKLLEEFGVKRLLLPLPGTKEEKDISDYFKAGNSREDFLKLFIEFLDNLYSDTLIMLKSCEIDFNNPPAKAQEIISAGDVPLGTQGNLFGITGGEGTGKSNYVAAIVAGCICPAGAEVDTLGIQITANGRYKAVLLYDTEQSEVQLFKNVSNLLARAKQPDKPDELKAFCLTGMSRKERLNAIVQSMDKFYYQYGGIQLVVIDGIADLVKSANDEAESVAVIDELYRLAGIYNTCILCVLHFVPNGLKLRGHLGSELQRKAATILSIEKDEEPTQSVVKALKVRDGSPLDVPLMLFAWDKKAGMHVYKGEKPREEKEKRKERELVNVARDIFGRQTRITYIDLCEQLQQVLDIKERTAKSYIRFMRERDIITKDTANQSCFVIGSYNLQRNTSCP